MSLLERAWSARRRWLDARTLRRRPIPDELWRLTLERHPFLAWRSVPDLVRLRELATLFLARKEFFGADGLLVTDEMAVAIAAQAALPVLRLGLGLYDGFVGIVVHRDQVLARREETDDDGIVHQFDEELSGEAMQGGPVAMCGSLGAEVIDLLRGQFAVSPEITPETLHQFADLTSWEGDAITVTWKR